MSDLVPPGSNLNVNVEQCVFRRPVTHFSLYSMFTVSHIVHINL